MIKIVRSGSTYHIFHKRDLICICPDNETAKMLSDVLIRHYRKETGLFAFLNGLATSLIIGTIMLTAYNVYPNNLYLGVLASSLWIYVGHLARHRALSVINAVGLASYANGIIAFYLKNGTFF